MRPARPLLISILFIGVATISTAAILVRLADAPALSTAALRMLFATLPSLALLRLRSRELRSIDRHGRARTLLAGICLALHFATWIASLQMTTVSSSVALVTTSPLFVVGTVLAGGGRLPRGTALAIAVCLVGGLLIGYADLLRGGRSLVGDLLALAGAAFAAAYFSLGKQVRRQASITTYIGIVYPVAAVCLVVISLAWQQPLTGFSGRTYLAIALMAAGPQLIGHSSLNWALGYLSAPFVTISILGEPVISTALAALFLGEMPGPARIAGGAVVLAGVYVGLRAELAEARRIEVAGRDSSPVPAPRPAAVH